MDRHSTIPSACRVEGRGRADIRRWFATLLLLILGNSAPCQVAVARADELAPTTAGQAPSVPPATIAGRSITDATGLLDAPERERQLVGAQVLARFGPAALDPLIAAIRHSDASVRTWAARGLRRFDDKAQWPDDRSAKAREVLLAALKDPSPSVRIAAAGALLSHGRSRPALQVLVAELESPIAAARVEAITELAGAGDATREVLDRVASAKDVPEQGDYVARIAQAILQRYSPQPQK